jgi:serine phosphatase RsbU (regulator of sigma subunit)
MSKQAETSGLRAVLRLRNQLKADSITLFIPDPWWPGALRVLYKPGVSVQEPMHGFLPPGLVERLSIAPPIAILDYSQKGDESRPVRHALLAELAKKESLYRDFVGRENIRVSVRAVHRSERTLNAVLFVNFTRPKRITKQHSQLIQDFMNTFVSRHLTHIRSELTAESFPAKAMMRLLAPIDHIATIGAVTGPSDSDKVFEELLEALFDAFGLDVDRDLGTVHLLDDGRGMLRLAAAICHGPPPVPKQRLGEGVVGWVALTRLGVKIDELPKSQFKRLYRATKGKSIVSEIAVPMFVGSECVGVVNLESHQPCAFESVHVRMMIYVATQAALAHHVARLTGQAAQLKQEQEIRARLTDLSGAEDRLGESLRILAELGRQHVGASRCDIWSVPMAGNPWRIAGSSPPLGLDRAAPRPTGWSAYARDHKRSLWLSHFGQNGEFSCAQWIESEWHTQAGDHQPERPAIMNVGGLGTARCQFVVPCLCGQDAVAIAWFSFDGMCSPPTPQRMQLVSTFADQIGMTVGGLRKEVVEHQHSVIATVANIINTAMTFDASGIDGLTMAIRRSSASSSVGGDFAAIIRPRPGAHRTLVLIGDAAGHGLAGAVRSLPWVMGFRLLTADSQSPSHILDKLWEAGNKLLPTTFGTALCLAIDTAAEKGAMSVATAGHHPLVVIDAGGKFTWIPDAAERPEDDHAVGGCFGSGETFHVSEASRALARGDLIIAYTDGICEARPATQTAFFGRDGIVKAIGALREPQAVADAIYDAALRHTGGRLADDASVVAVRFDGLPSRKADPLPQSADAKSSTVATRPVDVSRVGKAPSIAQ